MSKVEVAKTIEQRVIAFLNLGEDGQVLSFFGHVRKATERDLVSLETNLKTAAFQQTQKLDSLNDDLKDAEQAVKEAYESVDTTRIKTNADQKGYIEQYLNQVKSAEAGVQTVKDRIESANESHKDLVKSYEDKIKTLKTRLATFSGE